jgi:hypothetical protein
MNKYSEVVSKLEDVAETLKQVAFTLGSTDDLLSSDEFNDAVQRVIDDCDMLNGPSFSNAVSSEVEEALQKGSYLEAISDEIVGDREFKSKLRAIVREEIETSEMDIEDAVRAVMDSNYMTEFILDHYISQRMTEIAMNSCDAWARSGGLYEALRAIENDRKASLDKIEKLTKELAAAKASLAAVAIIGENQNG